MRPLDGTTPAKPGSFIVYRFDQIILKVKHIGKEAHLSFPLALLVNDKGNDKAKCVET